MKKIFFTFVFLIIALLYITAEMHEKLSAKYDAFDSKYKDITLYQTVRSDDENGFFIIDVISKRKGDKFAVSTVVSDADSISRFLIGMRTDILSNGTDTWIIMDGADTSTVSKEEANNFVYDNIIFWWKLIDSSFKVLKDVNINGKTCLVFESIKEYDDPEGSFTVSQTYWVDKASLELVQSVFKNTYDNAQDITYYSDYKKLSENIRIPWKIEISSTDGFRMTGIIDSLKTNTGLADKIFSLKK